MLPIHNLTDLSDKVAIVTGGVGIGQGIAYRLAEAGAKVVVASRSIESANETVALLEKKGWQAFAVKADVANEKDVMNLVQTAVIQYGGVDILVNNAGIYPAVTLANMTLANFEDVIAINLKGVFLCTKHVSEQMKKQGRGGKIINITSIDSMHPSSMGLAHYDASKHGVWGFTKNVALELAQYKIYVNAIAPGAIATPGVKKQSGATVDPQMLEKFLAKIPMKRMGEPDDIGKVALFLASDMASYMTGAQITVDGGVLLS